MADTLSQKSLGFLSCVQCARVNALAELRALGVELQLLGDNVVMGQIKFKTIFEDQIRDA